MAKINYQKIADDLIKKFNISMTQDGNIWIQDPYSNNGDTVSDEKLRRIIAQYNKKALATEADGVSGILKHIKDTCNEVEQEQHYSSAIAYFSNGYLEPTKSENGKDGGHPYTEEEAHKFHAFQHAGAFDPDQPESPITQQIDKIINNTFTEETDRNKIDTETRDTCLAFYYLGQTPLQTKQWLIQTGANDCGKTLMCEFTAATAGAEGAGCFNGNDITGAFPLETIKNRTFTYCGEAPNEMLPTDTIKTIIGDDMQSYNEKNKKKTCIYLYTTPVINTNNEVRYDGKDTGIRSKLAIVKFHRRFGDEDQDLAITKEEKNNLLQNKDVGNGGIIQTFKAFNKKFNGRIIQLSPAIKENIIAIGYKTSLICRTINNQLMPKITEEDPELFIYPAKFYGYLRTQAGQETGMDTEAPDFESKKIPNFKGKEDNAWDQFKEQLNLAYKNELIFSTAKKDRKDTTLGGKRVIGFTIQKRGLQVIDTDEGREFKIQQLQEEIRLNRVTISCIEEDIATLRAKMRGKENGIH